MTAAGRRPAARRVAWRSATTLASGTRAERLRILALGALLVAGLTVILTLPGYDPRGAIVAGRPSAGDIVAPRAVSFVSRLLTEQARSAAARSISPVYGSREPDIAARQRQRLAEVMDYAAVVSANPYANAEEKRADLAAAPELGALPSRVLDSLLELDPAAWQALVAEVDRLVRLGMRSVVTPTEVPVPVGDIVGSVDPAMDGSSAELVASLAAAFIAPTVAVDEALTAAARRAAQDAIAPVTVAYAAGQIIVRAGDPVRAEHVEAMAALGLLRRPITGRRVLGMLVLLAVVVAVGYACLARLDRGLVGRSSQLGVAVLLVLAFSAAARVAVPGHLLLGYLLPTAAAAMTVCVIGGLEMGLVAGAVLALAIGLIDGANPQLSAYVLIGGTVGAVVLGRVERFSAFLLAALAVGGANLAAVAGIRLAESALDARGAAELAAVALGNGALSSGLAALLVLASGPLLGITTSIQLLELARPDHPLLRQLQLRAPGTYQHSLQIGNLAEAAATAVGADALLVRVAAYYHDIGKSVRPAFFIENQLPGQNPHDNLDPDASARVVIAHVTDGIEMARAHRLPAPIVDGIREHHGTLRAEYFYQRALIEADGAPTDEAVFRYPGPRPRSPETAILMLADAAEAAVRAAGPRTAGEMAEVLERILRQRMDAGQLDDSDLTLRHVQQIRDVFVGVLQSVYHPRIRYPEGVQPRSDGAAGESAAS